MRRNDSKANGKRQAESQRAFCQRNLFDFSSFLTVSSGYRVAFQKSQKGGKLWNNGIFIPLLKHSILLFAVSRIFL